MLTLTSTGQIAGHARNLAKFPDELAQFLPALGEQPQPRSTLAIALGEVGDDSGRVAGLTEIRDRCLFNASVTKEACVGVSRLMTPNWQAQLLTVGAVRTALEAAGLVCWLLKPGLRPDQRLANYLGSAEQEAKQGGAFINIAIRDAPHLKNDLAAVGTRSLRPTRDVRDEIKAKGITPATMLEPGALAAEIEDEALYRAFSSAVHASTAGIKEFNQLLIDPDRRIDLFIDLIELTARAHAVVTIRAYEYVRGPMTNDLKERLKSCAARLGVEESRLYPKE